jgi:hypothetical protein
MPYFAGQDDRTPRRPPYPAPRDASRHRELTAVLAVAVVLAHLLLAQLTLVLAAVMYVVDRVSRWRPQWLAVPAGFGLLWTLAIGPSRAGSGLTAGPRKVLAYLGAIGRYPGHALRPFGAYAGLGHWLPEQFPLALILAAAEVLLLSYLRRRQADRDAWRTGLVVATRRLLTTSALRSGGVVTRNGCCVGVDVATGRRAEISWPEAEGGVLCAGAALTAETGLTPGSGLAPGAGLTADGGQTTGAGFTVSNGLTTQAGRGTGTGPGPAAGPMPARAVTGGDGLADSGFMLAHAAIRRRKPVIVIDLTGSRWLAEALAAACVEPGAPFALFSRAGPGYYEPLRGGDPARVAGLVMGMLDWADVGDQQRRSCAAYLTDALAVQAAAPGDRRTAVLDDLVRLMTPDGLRERAALIPRYHPRREVLTDRAGVSASLLQADPATVTAPATQLSRLRASELGRWLQPGPPDAARISLGRTVRERGVTLLSLDRSGHGSHASHVSHASHGEYARMIAGLAVTDLLAVCGELQGMSVPGDSLVWINGCELLEQRVLAELIAQGQGAGMGVVLSTASAAAADRLVTEVNVLVARGPVDPVLVAKFMSRNGNGAAPAVTPDASTSAPTGPAAGHPFRINGEDQPGAEVPLLGADAFALLAIRPQRRMLPRCRAVAARTVAGQTVAAQTVGASLAGLPG